MEKVKEATTESEETCNECGMNESECGGHNDEEKLDEWANSRNGSSNDESFLADLAFMTKTISGGLNNIKKDQTVMPNTKVKVENAEPSLADLIKKMNSIN